MRNLSFFDASMAETIVPLDELLNLQDFVREGLPLEDPAAYKDFIDDRMSTARKILAAASEATRSLKKGATDMKSVLQAHKTSENLRQNRNAAESAKTKKANYRSMLPRPILLQPCRN